jgi:uncharacterized SAM-binding protein YcdF (DUF218 family)
MFLFLSKLLPIFIYPVGLTCILLGLAYFLPQRPRWQRGLLGAAFLLLWLASSGWVGMGLMHSLEWRYLPPTDIPVADVIVVLGGATEAAVYPRPLVEINEAGDRLLMGAWLYKQGKAAHVLLSGGRVGVMRPEETNSEAEDMLVVMEMLGVPATAVILETASRNTYENALYSHPLLEELGSQKILLVTSAAHMPRAAAIFAKQGINVTPIPTDFAVTQQDWEYATRPNLLVQMGNFLPTLENLEMTTHALKEYIGLVIYRWRGWA